MTVTEAEAEAVTEAGAVTEAETVTVTEAEAETVTHTEAETVTHTEAETDTEADAETVAEAEAETDTEAVTEAETDTEAEADTETEAVTDTEAEAETGAETETETEAEAEAEAGAGGEPRRKAEGGAGGVGGGGAKRGEGARPRGAARYRARMQLPFLSEAWFAKVDELVAAAGDLQIPSALKDVEINVTVTTAGGQVPLLLKDGLFHRGHKDGVTTSLTVAEAVARKIFVEGDVAAGVQAFLTGEIQVQGDLAKVVAMQTVEPSGPQRELTLKLAAITA